MFLEGEWEYVSDYKMSPFGPSPEPPVIDAKFAEDLLKYYVKLYCDTVAELEKTKLRLEIEQEHHQYWKKKARENG